MFKEEKLIEELDNIIHSEFAVSYPPWSELGHEDLARSVITWRKVITRIGKAVLSGEYPELDELLGAAGRFGVSKHGVTVEHFWEEDIKLWRMELKAINYTGMMNFEYTYYAHRKEDLPWPEGRTHDFDLIAFRKEGEK